MFVLLATTKGFLFGWMVGWIGNGFGVWNIVGIKGLLGFWGSFSPGFKLGIVLESPSSSWCWLNAFECGTHST